MKTHSRILISIITLFLLFAVGCGGGGGDPIQPPPPPPPSDPAEVNLGTNTSLTTQNIGDLGGTINGPAGSPLDGISVEFPAGALPGNTDVSLGFNNGTVIPVDGTSGGTLLVLDTNTVDEFSQPVEITFPYSGVGAIPIPYYVDDSGGLHLMELVEIDSVNGTATFSTYHASIFTWILDILGLSDPADTYSTSYRPAEDGFQIVNTGSDYNRGGECFGMTSFSLWYFEHHIASGDFYPRFMYNVGTRKGQNIIATRAHTSIAQQWSQYIPTVSAERNLTDEQNYTIIRNALLNTANPVLVYLAHMDGSPGAHSVLAYGYNSGTFSIYDPNSPGQIRQIIYNTVSQEFNTYSGYDRINYNGDGSLHLTESYTNVLNESVAQFASPDATINITSHADGEEVFTRDVTLAGTIESGEVLVEKLDVWVGSDKFSTEVPESGTFSLEIPVEAGVNHLLFDTWGRNQSGTEINVLNDMIAEDFTLVGVFPTAAILVTLTWDKDDTDVDLYTIDPTGDYSCYYHMVTADGGVLDIDVIFGYGPEHWTLTTVDTVRYGEDYRIRLHYYDDHGNGGTNYFVNILLYEGTAYEIQYNFTGYLSANDWENDGPNDTGADWRDIAVITPVEHSGSAFTSDGPQVTQDTNGQIHLTVPIPDSEFRVK